MSNNIVNMTVEILDKSYTIKCQESDLPTLQQAATYLNTKMTEIKNASQAVNMERVAIITALNIASEYLQLDQQKNNFVHKLNQRIHHLQNKLDEAIHKALQMELVCSSE